MYDPGSAWSRLLTRRRSKGNSSLGSPSPIPLVRQTDALPMLEALRQAGAPIGKLLREAELPEALQERQDGFIPFRSMLRFVGLAARSQDMPDVSWRGVLHAGADQLGGWGRAVSECRTLRRAILTFCEYFSRDAPLMELGLDVGDEYAWFWRRRPRAVIGWLGDEEGQQFAVAAMTRIVRAAAGPRWTPPRIQLESATGSWLADIPGLADCQVALRSPVVAIAVPCELLDQSLVWSEAGGPEADEVRTLETAAETLAGSLRQAFASLLPATQPSLEVAAELAGLSPRTFRRRLAEEGTSWRKVLDEARLEACNRLLRDPELTLDEIAGQLGYSDPAHLTRAFRRWTGEAPSSYRRRLS